MMLRALFDEGRRAEIRDALKSGRLIIFRGRPPELEGPEPGGSFHSRISQELGKAYGTQRYVITAPFLGGALERAAMTARIRARMAKAVVAPEGNQKPKENEPEEKKGQ